MPFAIRALQVDGGRSSRLSSSRPASSVGCACSCCARSLARVEWIARARSAHSHGGVLSGHRLRAGDHWFDGANRGCYDAYAGWSSLVARWAHNLTLLRIPWSSLGHPKELLQIGRPAQQCAGRSLVKVGGTYVARAIWQYRTKPLKLGEGVETGWRAPLVGEGTVRLSPKGESDRITQRSAVQIRPPQPSELTKGPPHCAAPFLFRRDPTFPQPHNAASCRQVGERVESHLRVSSIP